MARFFGSMAGTRRREHTVTGGGNTPITAHLRGKHVGLEMSVRDCAGVDSVGVDLTAGSKGGSFRRPVCIVHRDGGGDFVVALFNPSNGAHVSTHTFNRADGPKVDA